MRLRAELHRDARSLLFLNIQLTRASLLRGLLHVCMHAFNNHCEVSWVWSVYRTWVCPSHSVYFERNAEVIGCADIHSNVKILTMNLENVLCCQK